MATVSPSSLRRRRNLPFPKTGRAVAEALLDVRQFEAAATTSSKLTPAAGAGLPPLLGSGRYEAPVIEDPSSPRRCDLTLRNSLGPRPCTTASANR